MKALESQIQFRAFPSDYYAVASQIEMRGLDPSECLVEVSNPDGPVLNNDDIISTIESIGEELALVLFPGKDLSRDICRDRVIFGVKTHK